MNEITEGDDWEKKISYENIVAKWKEEATVLDMSEETIS